MSSVGSWGAGTPGSAGWPGGPVSSSPVRLAGSPIWRGPAAGLAPLQGDRGGSARDRHRHGNVGFPRQPGSPPRKPWFSSSRLAMRSTNSLWSPPGPLEVPIPEPCKTGNGGAGLYPGREPFTKSLVNSQLFPTLSQAQNRVSGYSHRDSTYIIQSCQPDRTNEGHSPGGSPAWGFSGAGQHCPEAGRGRPLGVGVVGVGRDLVTAFVHCAQSRMHL